MFDFKTYYDNFALDNPTVSLTVIIWAICIGLCVGTVFYTIAKQSSANLIKRLAKGEHFTADKAVTLEELGVKPSWLLKRALRNDQPLRKYVIIENADECIIEKKPAKFFAAVYKFFRGEDIPVKHDLKKVRVYLPEETRHTAEIRYVSKGSPVFGIILSVVLFTLIAVGLSFCMPKLLELLDKMISAYKNL